MAETRTFIQKDSEAGQGIALGSILFAVGPASESNPGILLQS